MACSFSLVSAEEIQPVKQTHTHFEDGVVYCDVQTFDQEPFILKVIGGGSPMTVFWQFDVQKHRQTWVDTSVALVRLGRQVIPDLVTKRWLMRDLSGGLVKYTSDIRIAMRFLTEMNHAAVVDVSVLEAEAEYVLETTLYMHEGEWEESGWWSSLFNWGEDMGTVTLELQDKEPAVE
ncbi:MAG: DUF4390 domain-containing protein [Ghiorsea sp.]